MVDKHSDAICHVEVIKISVSTQKVICKDSADTRCTLGSEFIHVTLCFGICGALKKIVIQSIWLVGMCLLDSGRLLPFPQHLCKFP